MDSKEQILNTPPEEMMDKAINYANMSKEKAEKISAENGEIKPLTDDNQPIEIDVDGVEPKGIAISVGKGKTIFSPNGEIKQQTDDGEDIDELVEEEPADVCEYCEGTGKVPKLTLDTSENMPSGGEWVDSGELETCICRIEK